MNKTAMLIGFAIGILISLLGSYLFITLFTSYSFMDGIHSMKSEGKLGKLITLGTVLDLVLFGILLKMNKDMMARGVVFAVILIAIITLFV